MILDLTNYNTVSEEKSWVATLLFCLLLPGHRFELLGHARVPDDAKADIAEVHYPSGVTVESARQCLKDFNSAYTLVGKDLGYAARRVTVYIYPSTDDLLDDIINRFGYDAAFFRAPPAPLPG